MNFIYVYDYDSITKEYIGLTESYESPLEPGKFLLPAHSTNIEPPEEIQGKARCFINEEWVYITDLRGQKIYNINNSLDTQIITKLGDDLPENYILITPPDENNKYIYNGEIWILYVEPPTVKTYDNIMEQHLYDERVARGYTTREPSEYAGSTVERWAQDAQDWIRHRDEVMLYGLEVENHYKETGEAPTPEEFKANLPIIHWTYDLAE